MSTIDTGVPPWDLSQHISESFQILNHRWFSQFEPDYNIQMDKVDKADPLSDDDSVYDGDSTSDGDSDDYSDISLTLLFNR